MVYGIIMLLNFAHGDVIMIGGYIALLTIAAGLHPALAVVLTIIGCVALSVVIEKVAYRPLRSAPRISLLITAIGVSLLLQNLAQLIWTANTRSFPATKIIPSVTYQIGSLSISLSAIVTIVVFGALDAGAHVPRAENAHGQGHARRLGGYGGRAADGHQHQQHHHLHVCHRLGAGGHRRGAVLLPLPVVNPTIGSLLGLKAFVAAVLGGIGSIPGAMIGGLAIGFAEVLVTALGLSEWTDAVVFAVLIVVLLVRPTGFLGRSMAEKV